MYFLQNRWKIENNVLRYYGLRNKENMFKNTVKLNSKQLNILKKLPADLTADELSLISSFVGIQVVTEEKLHAVPKSLEEARFCKNCIANDFMIPGIEFDEEGLCPLCQTKEETKELKSVVPLVDEIPVSKKSRFDVAVFYTGGKDSTYLLYYLSKIKKLRVLALTWELPYISECARKSIENAKEVKVYIHDMEDKYSDEVKDTMDTLDISVEEIEEKLREYDLTKNYDEYESMSEQEKANYDALA